MAIIISFFIGVILIAAGSDIRVLTGIDWISLLCDAIGGCLMAYGAKLYFDTRQEDMKGRTLIIKNLENIDEKVMTSSQAEYIQTQLCSINDNLEKVNDANEMLEKRLMEFEKLYQSNAYTNEDGKEDVETIKNCMYELKESIERFAEKVLQDTNGQVENQIEEMRAINQSVKDNSKAMRQISQKEIDQIERLSNKIELINKLPAELSEMIDELIEKINDYVEYSTEKIEQLSEDLQDLDEKRTNNFNKIIKEIRESNEVKNDHIADQICKLSEEYSKFEDIVNNIVKQMTLMSENDYEIMKGFLNG